MPVTDLMVGRQGTGDYALTSIQVFESRVTVEKSFFLEEVPLGFSQGKDIGHLKPEKGKMKILSTHQYQSPTNDCLYLPHTK